MTMFRHVEASPKDRPGKVDAGPAPMLQWIRIDKLVVDDTYQRELKFGNWKAIRRIADNFLWSRFSPVFVAPVEGGRFAIIDGQHRTHAAAMCGFAEVPCQVVQMSVEEQAAAFAAVNGLVTKVTTWQIYKAAHAAGEEWAMKIASCAEEAGCKVMFRNASSWAKKPGEIYAINQFKEIVEAFSPGPVTAALRIMMQAKGICDNYEAWDAMILRAMVSALCTRQPAMNNPLVVRVLEDFDLLGVMDKIKAATRDRIRRGEPYAPKREQLQNAITAMLDRRLPARMALPESV